jgi:prepilin-type N-terminal cleavage/methylation domain-containing protein
MFNHAETCTQVGNSRQYSSQQGFSLLETLVTLMLGVIVSNIVVSNLKQLDNPLQNGVAQVTGFIKGVRARAISQTIAYKIQPTSLGRLSASFAPTCSAATFTTDPSLGLVLPNTTRFTNTTWSICFTSRGLSTENSTIQLRDGSTVRTLETMLGGGVREL